MELRLGARTFGSREFAIMTDGPAKGADIAEVAADPALIRAVRSDHPVIAVAPGSAERAEACVRAGADLLIGDDLAEIAAATGAGLICSAPEHAAGVRPDGILLRAADPARAESLVAAGHAVLADEPTPALVAVYAWLGARVFRTSDVDGTREVLDMVASIKGTRPPAVARRGLA
jgi:hypothetical protein